MPLDWGSLLQFFQGFQGAKGTSSQVPNPDQAKVSGMPYDPNSPFANPSLEAMETTPTLTQGAAPTFGNRFGQGLESLGSYYMNRPTQKGRGGSGQGGGLSNIMSILKFFM
jgi:hypothetical protein